jgi:hypothetical protein
MQDKIAQKIQGVDLLKRIGALGLEEEDQAQILADASEIILEAVMIRIVDLLPEEDAVEVNKLFDEGKDDEAMKLIDQKVPNFMEILDEEIEAFAKEAIEMMGGFDSDKEE